MLRWWSSKPVFWTLWTVCRLRKQHPARHILTHPSAGLLPIGISPCNAALESSTHLIHVIAKKTKKLGWWLLFSHYIISTLVRIWLFIVKIRCIGFFFKGGKNNTTRGTLRWTNKRSISCNNKERTITTVLLDIYIKVSLNNKFLTKMI